MTLGVLCTNTFTLGRVAFVRILELAFVRISMTFTCQNQYLIDCHLSESIFNSTVTCQNQYLIRLSLVRINI